MKSVIKNNTARFVILSLVFLLGGVARGADQPLSVDDVRLLLIGGAAPAKMQALIAQRGINFRLTPELEKKFRDDGAREAVIQELRKAESKPGSTPAETHATPARQEAAKGDQAAPTDKSAPPERAAPTEPASGMKGQPSVPSSTDRQIAEAMAALGDHPSAEDLPTAPSFTLKDLSGHRLALDDYKGKVVLLDFWATWCGPCRTEIPAFVRFQNQYRDRGLQIIGISVDSSSGPVKKFYQDYMMNYRVGMCDQTTRRIYGGLAGVPTTLLIGRDGRIHTKVVGAPANLAMFEDRIRALLGPESGGAVMASGRAAGKPVLTASTNATSSSSEAKISASAVQASATTTPAAEPSSRTSLAREVASTRTVIPETRASRVDLSDPPPDQVQKIIQEFAAKEKLFKEARNNYAYHQSNKVEEIAPEGDIGGVYEQEWDILYDDAGKRIERVTYAPLNTLSQLILTEEDLNAFRNINPFVLTSDELPDYETKYLGHVKVDEITAYVFSIRPKEILKGRQFFQGVIWVDDRDLQIVKSEGKSVGVLKKTKQENLFPRFTTYREQIDGKYWFPTFTTAEDTLNFSQGPAVHMKEIIRYSDYKQFKSKTRILSATPTDEPNAKPITPQNEKQKQ